MRIAVISDIHANLQAWQAVWLDIRSSSVDRVVCLGDVVGYGPNPAEVLEGLYTSVDYFVLGNHDAAICGKMDRALFSDNARLLIDWTAGRLGKRAIQVLNTWPLTLAGPGFRCAHGEFGNPEYFNYICEAEETGPSWQAVPEPLLFVGHTHQPCLYVIGASGTPHHLAPQEFVIENGKRYLVNVGSVGYSRDGDPRASYCLYDTAAAAIFWRRIPFDLDAYRLALERAGLPTDAAALLAADQRQRRPPLREMVSFHPPDRPEQAVQNAVEVRHVERLRRRVRYWQLLFIGALVALMVLLAVAGGVWRYHTHRRIDLIGLPMPARQSSDLAPGDNALVFPAESITAGQPVPGWHIHLGNRYYQRAEWTNLPEEGLGWRLQSDRLNRLSITSPLIYVAPDMKFTLQGRVRKSRDFKGSLALVISLIRQVEDGSNSLPRGNEVDQFIVKEPTLVRADGWSTVKQTFEIPANAEAIRFQIRGSFQGSASLCNLALERKK